MSVIFIVLLLIAFGLWAAAAAPNARIGEFWPRVFFFLAACVWAIPMLSFRA